MILTLVLVIVIAAPVVALLLLEAPELGLGAAGRIAVIRIVGPLEFKGYSILGPPVDAKTYIELIEKALEDPGIRAVVIRVNSPGGDAAASEALYYAVKKLAENKTVVAYIEGLGASGAYEMILPCDLIVAGESSIVGAVGVHTVVVNVEGLMEKLGGEGVRLQVRLAQGPRLALQGAHERGGGSVQRDHGQHVREPQVQSAGA